MLDPDCPTDVARFVSTKPGCTDETQISPSPFRALGEPGPYILCRVLVCRMLASLLCPYRGHGPLSLSDRSSKLMPPLGAPRWPDEVRLTMRTPPGGSALAVWGGGGGGGAGGARGAGGGGGRGAAGP